MAAYSMNGSGLRGLMRSARAFKPASRRSVRAMSSGSPGVQPPDVRELARMAQLDVTDQQV